MPLAIDKYFCFKKHYLEGSLSKFYGWFLGGRVPLFDKVFFAVRVKGSAVIFLANSRAET